MKHVLASLTIGACLLLPSAGVVLGAGPPTKPAQNPTTGQHGSNHGFSCTQAGTVYAGNPDTASVAHANSTAAVSQYDVACANQMP